MTDTTTSPSNVTINQGYTPRPQGNKPDLYIQEVIREGNGETTFQDIAATWNKDGYSSGKLDKHRQIVIRTYEQREALFAKRKEQQGVSKGLTKPLTPKPSM